MSTVAMSVFATLLNTWVSTYKKSKYAFASSFPNFGLKVKHMLLPYLILLGALVVSATAELGKYIVTELRNKKSHMIQICKPTSLKNRLFVQILFRASSR